MGDEREKRRTEDPDVEAHRPKNAIDTPVEDEEDDDTPDVEAHRHKNAG